MSTERSWGRVPDYPCNWNITCHGCGERAAGESVSYELALSAVESWKSEHRLTLGCQVAPTSYSVSAK